MNKSLSEILLRIKTAKRTSDDVMLQDAFYDLDQLMKSVFIGYMENKIRLVRDETYIVTIEDAADYLNEAMTRIWLHVDSWHGKTNEEAESWIRTILTNLLADELRKRNRRSGFWTSFLKRITRSQKMLLEDGKNE